MKSVAFLAFVLIVPFLLRAALVPLAPVDGGLVKLVSGAQKSVMGMPMMDARIKLLQEDRKAGETRSGFRGLGKWWSKSGGLHLSAAVLPTSLFVGWSGFPGWLVHGRAVGCKIILDHGEIHFRPMGKAF